ncbi:MAG: hypothetical protein JWN98_609 [Abditibacteriota bacterium]|nr:hypothetical protein [Abditibacteriota bacterium]
MNTHCTTTCHHFAHDANSVVAGVVVPVVSKRAAVKRVIKRAATKRIATKRIATKRASSGTCVYSAIWAFA